VKLKQAYKRLKKGQSEISTIFARFRSTDWASYS